MKQKDDLLFEDNHVLAFNKPSGLLTQQAKRGDDNLEDRARSYLKEKTGKSSVFLHAIHRLDRVTSGVCVFAKSSKALSRMQMALRERQVKKNYLAIVEKKPATNQGKVELIQAKENHRANIATEGKTSVLHYEVLAENQGYTLLQIDLVTGRYHQIRLALSQMNCPILGDQKYGSKVAVDFEGICLHQQSFMIKHPTKDEPLVLEAPWPQSKYWELFGQAQVF